MTDRECLRTFHIATIPSRNPAMAETAAPQAAEAAKVLEAHHYDLAAIEAEPGRYLGQEWEVAS
jgi:hypothetical protein